MRVNLPFLFSFPLVTLCACASLLGVDLEVNERPVECIAKSCEQLGVRCGAPDNGCGEILQCDSDCADGCTPSQFNAVCKDACGLSMADGCGGTHQCPPCVSSSGAATDTAPDHNNNATGSSGSSATGSSSGATADSSSGATASSSGNSGANASSSGNNDANGSTRSSSGAAASSSGSSSGCTPTPEAQACAGRCGLQTANGCGGNYTCAPPSGRICYQGNPCLPKTRAELCASNTCGRQSNQCGGFEQCDPCPSGQCCSALSSTCINESSAGVQCRLNVDPE